MTSLVGFVAFWVAVVGCIVGVVVLEIVFGVGVQ